MSEQPTPRIWRWSWQVSQNAKALFWIGSILFVAFFIAPALTGWLIGEAFEALTGQNTGRLYWIAVIIFTAEMARMLIVFYGGQIFILAWKLMQTLLQSNMLAGQMSSGGPDAARPATSIGEAISWFRDDPEDVANFIDSWLDAFGGLVFTIISVLVLGALDWRATAIVLIPMATVAVVTKVVDDRVKRYRQADRRATAAFTASLNDVLAASTSINVNNASHSVVANLRTLADVRRSTSVKDRVLEDGIMAFASGSGDLAFGLLLVVSATAISTGDLSAPELAVFASYLAYLNFLPRMIGRMLARRKQAQVSYENMTRLVASGDRLSRARPLPSSMKQLDELLPDASDLGSDLAADTKDGDPLEHLRIEGLSVSLGSEGEMVPVLTDVSFEIEKGSFTVVTGAVGAGKSTLLHALIGVIWEGDDPMGRVEGSVRWNGEEIADRGAFMIPPRCAFLPQVPQLLSDSIADNISLTGASGNVQTALSLAAVDRDIAEMAEGVDTLVGPRGLRLSGGQRQRVATARALVREADLIVLDDLSSALDVETELRLWRNLRDAGFTILAVSHRPVALDVADQVLLVAGGSVSRG